MDELSLSATNEIDKPTVTPTIRPMVKWLATGAVISPIKHSNSCMDIYPPAMLVLIYMLLSLFDC